MPLLPPRPEVTREQFPRAQRQHRNNREGEEESGPWTAKATVELLTVFGYWFFFFFKNIFLFDFLGGAVVKNLPADAGDVVLIPGLGRSPGVGNGNLLQYSCLENSMDRGAKGAIVHS